MKLEVFYTAEETIKSMKRQARKMRKKPYIHDRISRVLKEHTQDLSNKKSNNQVSEGIHERVDSSQNMK